MIQRSRMSAFPDVFPQNVVNAKSGRNMVMEKSRNGHGKVMEKYFFKSVGTLSKGF